MEDRKRPAAHSVDELAPPSKRAAVNGSNKTRDDNTDSKEDSWVEDFQKGAIYRQMQEFKREKNLTEARLEAIQSRAEYFDDHLRVLDGWWLQFLQEVELLARGTIKSQPDTQSFPNTSGLSFKEQQDVRRHLEEKGSKIRSSLEPLFSRLAAARGEVPSEVAELESQIKSLLASQKEYSLKLDRALVEKDSLSAQLDVATLRYFKSEKKMDRAKSAQVQKLEQAAYANSTRKPASGANGAGRDEVDSATDNSELVGQYEESLAITTKLKQQLESALTEVKTIQEENTSLKIQKAAASDEDYARTDLFKQFRGQNEDLIKRINHLEATNRQLREEAEKMRAERTTFKVQLEREAQALTGELEDQIQQKEIDLTRIRSVRDELLADQGIRKAYQLQEQTALEHAKELLSAGEERTNALEMQIERIKSTADATSAETDTAELDSMSSESLKQKLLQLQRDFESINKELPSMERAYKKAMGLASKKVMDFVQLEEKVTMHALEKAKADQKYFAARKDADTRNNEIKALRAQNGKSSEIIAQLKDAEFQARMIVSNLDKQLSDLKQTNINAMDENRTLKAASTEASRRFDAAKNQVNELTNLLRSHDSSTAAMKQKVAGQDGELERLKVRVSTAQKEKDEWKTKCLNNSSEEEDMLRKLAECSVCRKNFKDAVLKTCGHTFCMECMNDRVSNRMRKCPTCSRPFDKNDVLPAHL